MFQSGYVAILGAPNVGKSTLLNALLGEKLSIVTDKPQTTRHKIVGILNRPNVQILFLDTPGIHPSTKLLNEAMVQTALATVADADVVLHLVFPNRRPSEDDEMIRDRVKVSGKPYLILINRIDEIDKQRLLPLIQEIQEHFSPNEIIPISAKESDGLEKVLEAVQKFLPEGPAYYPTDQYTEHDMRFLVGEIVREKAMQLLHQEIPYQLATHVESFQEEPGLTRINVTVLVEKSSQKAIVIGKGGEMLKKIGQLARLEIQKLVGAKVFLELFVRVQEGWTKEANQLRELGILNPK